MRWFLWAALGAVGVVLCSCGGKANERDATSRGGGPANSAGAVTAVDGLASTSFSGGGMGNGADPGAGGSTTTSSSGAAGKQGEAEGGAGGAGMDDWLVPPPDLESESVTFQLNAQHDGNQPSDTLRLPLALRWEHHFNEADAVGYAVAARGRVFATSGASSGKIVVSALSAETGEPLWQSDVLQSYSRRANLAYEDERVFYADVSGQVAAFDAATGVELWSTKVAMNGTETRSPPVSFRRVVYLSADRTLYALSGASGAILWSKPLTTYCYCSPTLFEDSVYLTVGAAVQAFDANTGAPRWQLDAPAAPAGVQGSLLGSGTMSLSGGLLFVRRGEQNRTLDISAVAYGPTFDADRVPAVQDGWVLSSKGGVIHGSSPTASFESWKFAEKDRQYFDCDPLVVGDKVVFDSIEGDLVVVNRDDGKEVSRAHVVEGIPRSSETLSGDPITGLSVAANRLFVPVNGRLLAY